MHICIYTVLRYQLISFESHVYITVAAAGLSKRGSSFFFFFFFKLDCQVWGWWKERKTRLSGVGMVKRARTRCRVDRLYFIDKKTNKQKTNKQGE